MKPPIRFLTALLIFCGFLSRAQVLEIEHLKILVDTIPFKFISSSNSKNYSRFREIRIGCLNTGTKDLLISGASQSFTNDTSWLKVADNVRYPNIIRPGSYGTFVIFYSVASPFEKIKITSNAKNGPQIISLIDTYREPVEFKRNMSDYPAKIKEGQTATFSSMIYNKSTKRITVDSVLFPDSTLKLLTSLPFVIDVGRSVSISLSANTKGKMNFYYGGIPMFFYHEENGFENFAKQEFSCIIVPDLQLLDRDTFDFGTVKRGTQISHTFHYLNKGSFSLETNKNTNECISFEKLKIEPGETFGVTIKYNTSVADSGNMMREFPVMLPPFFYSNSVFMTGFISGSAPPKSDFLQSDDRVIDCPTVSNDTARSVKRKISIKNNSGLPIRVTNVTVTEGAYAFSDVKTIIPAGGTFNIKFVYPTKVPGFFDKLITITYTTLDCSNAEFSYQIEIKGGIIAH